MEQLQKIVDAIKKDRNPRTVTPRQLFNAMGMERRTSGNCYWVDKFLNDNSLEVVPHYNDVWIDAPIELRHKPVATTHVPLDPIRRINVLDSATTIPLYVDNSSSIVSAMTLMQCHNYSQLPVTKNKERGLVGYISWETIGRAKANGVDSDMVRDYVDANVAQLLPDTPLIEAVSIVKKHDFAVVLAKDGSLFGIVTVSDITERFIEETEPFVLINEIENHLRILLNDKLLIEDLRKICKKQEREIGSIDDLSFGSYLDLLGHEESWKKVGINADRKAFVSKQGEVRQIRNEVMHFRPNGISAEKRDFLRQMNNYLRYLTPCN